MIRQDPESKALELGGKVRREILIHHVYSLQQMNNPAGVTRIFFSLKVQHVLY